MQGAPLLSPYLFLKLNLLLYVVKWSETILNSQVPRPETSMSKTAMAMTHECPAYYDGTTHNPQDLLSNTVTATLVMLENN